MFRHYCSCSMCCLTILFSVHITMENTHQTVEYTACILHVQSKLIEGGGYPRYQEQQLQLLSEWDPN
jgi:hypothetical protein